MVPADSEHVEPEDSVSDEFEKRMAAKKAEESEEENKQAEAEAKKVEEAAAGADLNKPMSPEELEAMDPIERYKRAESLLAKHIEQTNIFLRQIGEHFAHALKEMDYKIQDEHKHAVFTKEALRTLFKRCFGHDIYGENNEAV